MATPSRVCIIYTGGTIGMVQTHDGLRPPEDPRDFTRFAPELESFVDVDFEFLLNKDSTNMSPADWTKISEAIFRIAERERDSSDFAGFVIAHGTDTMHFSSSAVAFALGGELTFPVVFTGAQTAPQVPHGDARVNLVRACKVALTDLAEVVVSFGDFVFRGCRVQKKDERRFDAFEAPGYFPIGHITEVIDLHPSAKVRDPDCPRFDLARIDFRPDFETGVFQVALIPGLHPELVLPVIAHDACKGLMLQSFGWGNVPDEDPYSFEKVVSACVDDHRKPVLIVSQFPAHATEGSAYAPGLHAVKAGAIPTGNMTNAAAAAKFCWILEQITREGSARSDRLEEVRRRMQVNYVREMD